MTDDKRQSAPGESASLDWIDASIPYSPRFGDTYYSKAGGLAETDHVFIAGNSLPARWPAMRECTIGELGFGTGLNFLVTVYRWREIAPPGAKLHFVSFELYPLAPAEMTKALSRWPELNTLAQQLAEAWRPEPETLNVAFDANVELTVFLGDANALLPRHEFEADAWYLDGFAPSRNPQLWSARILSSIFAHTKPGGTFATYTAAGQVRRDLQAAGFSVERRPGFAGKREMLTGRRSA